MESAENQPIPTPQPEKEKTRNLSKVETIELLNDSIDRLEQTIKNLSQDSAKLPSSDSINSLLTTTKELADAVVTPPPPEPIVTATTPPVEATTSTQVKADIKPKSEVSSEPKPQISKRRQKNLISIVLGVTAIAIAVVAIFWLWLPNQKVATSPEPDVLKPTTEPTTEVVTNLEDPEPTVETVSEPQIKDDISVKVVDDVPVVETDDATLSAEILETVIPQDLESPAKAENLKVVAIEPELVFTPEQTLVAALPTKISQSIKDYKDFVDAIEVNLAQSRLLVEITDDWYSLDESRQNKLANKMLERSRQLDFNKLELKDSTGTLVARSPVIGDRIIILESSKNDKQPIAED